MVLLVIIICSFHAHTPPLPSAHLIVQAKAEARMPPIMFQQGQHCLAAVPAFTECFQRPSLQPQKASVMCSVTCPATLHSPAPWHSVSLLNLLGLLRRRYSGTVRTQSAHPNNARRCKETLPIVPQVTPPDWRRRPVLLSESAEGQVSGRCQHIYGGGDTGQAALRARRRYGLRPWCRRGSRHCEGCRRCQSGCRGPRPRARPHRRRPR